ncbi:MAG TPA: SDR family NAD(P)-dependent oxidoreductase [Solirubrobacterales bacterium]|nr:SDR family NAD(P)-dependent oxidoreductase [Solirubrobacterales bacterium]
MSYRSDGRTALVTGGGRGIGRAIALALAEQGARVALVSRSVDELESAATEVAALGGAEPSVIIADMSDPPQVREAARRAAEEIGPLDILINNAAVVWPLGPTAKVDPVEWEAAFGVNVFAVLRMTLEVLPGMVGRGWGRIVDVSSGIVAHPGGMVGGNAYAASKAALEAHVVNLAAELEGTGVTVNAFRPGAVDTAMQRWIREQDPAEIGAGLRERFVTGYESGMLLTPERSAEALLGHLDAGGSGQIWDVA